MTRIGSLNYWRCKTWRFLTITALYNDVFFPPCRNQTLLTLWFQSIIAREAPDFAGFIDNAHHSSIETLGVPIALLPTLLWVTFNAHASLKWLYQQSLLLLSISLAQLASK